MGVCVQSNRKGNAELWDLLPFPPQLPLFPPSFPPYPPSASCSLWPALVRFGLSHTSSSSPPFLLTLPSHPHFPLFSYPHFPTLLFPPTPTLLSPDTSCLHGGGVGWGSLPLHCSGLGQWWGLSPSEPVSQHCLRDWSLPSAPRPWGGARQLWVQPALLSAREEAPRWAGMGLETVCV